MKKRTGGQMIRLKMSVEINDAARTWILGGSSADEPTPRVEPPSLRKGLQECRVLWWGGVVREERSQDQEGEITGDKQRPDPPKGGSMGRALDSISTLARSGAAVRDLQQQKVEMGGGE
jgi:hypothetical protein